MLILSRRLGESFLIGNDIEIMVYEIQGDKVRIGINAPKNINVLRSELISEAKTVNREASASNIDIKALAKLLNSKDK